MDNLKNRFLQAWDSTREYWLYSIAIPLISVVIYFAIKLVFVDRRMTMKELLSNMEWLIPAVFGFLLVFAWHFFRVGLTLKSTYKFLRLAWKAVIHPKRSGELLTLLDEQKAHPVNWLYAVIDYIDLNRLGLAHHDNDVYVRFRIDSHLLFEIKEFNVFVQLCLAPDNIRSLESGWYPLAKPEHYAPIRPLERYRLSGKVHLEGKTDEEKELLRWMQDFRNGEKMLTMLKVAMTFGEGDSLQLLKWEGTRYIAPMNDYRME